MYITGGKPQLYNLMQFEMQQWILQIKGYRINNEKEFISLIKLNSEPYLKC